MGEGSLSDAAIAVQTSEPPLEDRQLVRWIAKQAPEEQARIATECFKHFLAAAAQPRNASSNACIKLCYFLDQCKGSSTSTIQNFAFQEQTCLDLFSFFIDWNEKNQHRSMRQVLELISSLIARNPDAKIAHSLKTTIIERTLKIISHQAALPLVKPAFKCLEYLIGKGTIPVHRLLGLRTEETTTGRTIIDDGDLRSDQDETLWDRFFNGVFEWLSLADVSPAAGKFLVTVFLALKKTRTASSVDTGEHHSVSWQRWISNGLARNPECLENVKNYLFSPLFKLDRPGSIVFLQDINAPMLLHDKTYRLNEEANQLLRLSAMETGKKAGLVEEPVTLDRLNTTKKTSSTIALAEDTLKPLVLHSSDTVRSLAFSVLVSSLSTIRPYTRVALEILKSCMGVLYLDTDAKFRNEVLSNTKHMIERLRGATSFMAREIESLSYQPGTDKMDEDQKQQQGRQLEEINILLQAHKDFLTWYLDFLVRELIPTASYQRHITSLKAILILLRSGINGEKQESARTSGNSTSWPFLIHFFSLSTIKLLLDLLLDPFEDVRTVAASILRIASPRDFYEQGIPEPTAALQSSEIATSISNLQNHDQRAGDLESGVFSNGNKVGAGRESPRAEENIEKSRTLGALFGFINRAQMLSKHTGRADYADGLARSFELLCYLQQSVQSRYDLISKLVDVLEEKVEFAENNLGQAVVGAPIHGDFAALRLVWDCFLTQTAPADFSDLNSTSQGVHTAQTSSSSNFASFFDLDSRGPELYFNSPTGCDPPSGLDKQPAFKTNQQVNLPLSRSSQSQLSERSAFMAQIDPKPSPSIKQSGIDQPQSDLPSLPHANLLLGLLQQRIFSACFRIWNAVKDILCDDSPEGLVPEDLEESNTVDTKNVLSYSFRAIHESSNLLRSIATKIEISLPGDNPLLSFELFEQIGDLTFDQLSHLRHRGAFSTVSLTFATCCKLTQAKGAAIAMAHKLDTWRDAAMDCIKTTESTTRRSAGIPVLVTGIMAAKPGQDHFHKIMDALMTIAQIPLPESKEEATKLPQVHAMNCLREAFKSSLLSAFCERYIGECLQLAVQSLESEVYAIRNCGLILLRSIIDTLFGTSNSKSEIETGWDGKSVRIQFDKYPELITILDDLLQVTDVNGVSQTEMVMSALYILHRAGPPSNDARQSVAKVVFQLSNPLWHVREMAARTLCSLTMTNGLTARLGDLLSIPTDNANLLHGSLLAAQFILERRVSELDDFNALMRTIKQMFQSELDSGLDRPFVQAGLVRLMNMLYMTALHSSMTASHGHTLALSDHGFSDLIADINQPNGFPALILAKAQQGLIVAALMKDHSKILEAVSTAIDALDDDAGLELVSTLSQIFELFESENDTAHIASVYKHMMQYYTSPDVVAIILDYFCNSLEDHREHLSLYTSQRVRDIIIDLGFTIGPLMVGGEALSNAMLRFTGCIIHAKIINTQFVEFTSRDFVRSLPDWQSVVKSLTQDEQDFDSRLAAAKSLSFGLRGFDSNSPVSKLAISALFTVFDVLSDDDEEIREIGADTCAYFSGNLVVPLAAGEWLAKVYMPSHFGSEEEFVAEVKRRVAASRPAERDDRLFAVEKLNLYRDEERDRAVWREVLAKL